MGQKRRIETGRLFGLVFYAALTAQAADGQHYAAVLRDPTAGGSTLPAAGRAKFRFRTDFSEMSYRLRLRAGELISNVRMHCGGPQGPVIALLAEAPATGWQGRVRLSASITAGNLDRNAGCAAFTGQPLITLAPLAEAMAAGEIFLTAMSAYSGGPTYQALVQAPEPNPAPAGGETATGSSSNLETVSIARSVPTPTVQNSGVSISVTAQGSPGVVTQASVSASTVPVVPVTPFATSSLPVFPSSSTISWPGFSTSGFSGSGFPSTFPVTAPISGPNFNFPAAGFNFPAVSPGSSVFFGSSGIIVR